MPDFTESVVEEAVLGWLGELKYAVAAGPDISPEGANPERATFADVILVGRLRAALVKINPTIPADAIDEAVRKVTHADTPSLIENNRRLHKLLTEGVDVEYSRLDGSVAGDKVWLIDFTSPDDNDFLAVNQFTVVEDRHTRRPDVVVFVNGMPLAVIELKNPTDETATTKDAFQQLQTYKAELPSLFGTNVLLVASDGLEARVGTLTADWERFMPWRTIDGQDIAPKGLPELDVMVKGVFTRRRLLDLLQNFVVFEVDGPTVIKKLAGYHQYHAVNKAVNCTVAASAPDGDRKVGVIWHTQGSGKSLTMAFYAGKVVRHDLMNNPTLLVLTDRNDLDDQLFGTFSGCHEPAPAEAGPGRGPRRPEGEAEGGVGRGRVHHDPEVRPGEGREVPAAVGAAQHRGDRGRGPPQPVRPGGQGQPGDRDHRLRVRQAPAGRPAERLVRRLHRHTHRTHRPEHSAGVR